MATRPHVHVMRPVASVAVTHGVEAAEFADLLVADDEWVRREFDAIVAAGWGGAVPPCPAPSQGAQWPRRPGYGDRPTPDRPLRGLLSRGRTYAHQRGPPDVRDRLICYPESV